MIGYVINAFEAAGCEPVIVTSPRTPMTTNWCRAQGYTFCTAGGRGFVEDMVAAVTTLDEKLPLFVSVSDIPCITGDIIRLIADIYGSSGKDACSIWIPSGLVKSFPGATPYREHVNGIEACPAGVNILLGDRISVPQDESRILLNEPRLAVNVNTREELAEAETFFSRHPAG
jgi:adenosylcobinamide-phosphate guanylyltransferase